MPWSASDPSIEELRDRYAKHGQEHVFRFYRELGEAARRRLRRQAAQIDLARVERLAALRASPGEGRADAVSEASVQMEVTPVDVERRPEHGGDAARWAAAEADGQSLLAAGRVGFLVMAGGQGSRLGHGGPKGLFPLGPVSERSLFALHAQKLRALERRSGRPCSWIVLTSDSTDAATREHFAAHDCFGLAPDSLRFVRQANVPAVDLAGRMFLAEPDCIFESPDGHGGCFAALQADATTGWLRERGVETLMTFQVDNPLARVGDAAFLGRHALSGAAMSSKVLARRPDDRMGVPVRKDGGVRMIEYSELPEALARQTADGPEGGLLHWAGSYAVHALQLDFVDRIGAEVEALLPYHPALKRIPHVAADGRRQDPNEPNGLKFERFIFDALPHAPRVTLVEGLREDEYAPLKTPDAVGGECPRTARDALSSQYRRWLAAADLTVPSDGWLEIDHSFGDSPEELQAHGWHSLEDAGPAVRWAEVRA